MRISDWSSDVCSSDLPDLDRRRSMTQPIAKTTVQRALHAHAAIGLIASALLYLVCLTGTVVVLYQEWQRIEQPDAPEMLTIAPDAVQKAAAAVLARAKGKIGRASGGGRGCEYV